MENITVSDLVELYNLESHPEGGFYKETYRSAELFSGKELPKFGGDRNYSTGIFFLLPEGSKSSFHRIKADEMWHFYLGEPMTIVQISPEGNIEKIVLGRDLKAGQKVQYVVPAGYWFGAYPNPGSKYSFAGCTVAPGFDFADFEMAERADLLKKYPNAKEVIEFLTD